MTEADDRLIEMAARNNADWCDVFCDLHGVRGEFRHDAWTSAARTPRYYPDAVTLVRSVDPAELLSRVDTSTGCSVKDSYADLDLTPWGFEVLFDASWMHRAGASQLDGAGPLSWEPVRDDAELGAWEAAWGGNPTAARAFLPGLLAREDVVILAVARRVRGRDRRRHPDLSRGCDRGPVEISTVLSTFYLVDAFASSAAAEACSGSGLGKRLVGYQAGATLHAAVRAGFELIGPPVVWLKPRSQQISVTWCGFVRMAAGPPERMVWVRTTRSISTHLEACMPSAITTTELSKQYRG